MYQYTICETNEKVLNKIICNKCKKEIEVINGISRGDSLEVEKQWGYFSNKDGEIHRFALCEECYDEFVKTFEIPVEIE